MLENIYALIRISTDDQNETRQVISMTELGISKKNILIEKESGKSTVRKKYHNLVKRLKADDILYIENVDRLSRDYDGIISEWHKLLRKGVIIRVLDTPILNTDEYGKDLLMRFIQDILLHILAYQAESEWHKIKNRQAQGIAVAKASGKHLGRAKKERTEEEIKVVNQYIDREITLDTALSLIGMKKSGFYKLFNVVKDID